ncbi:MAG: Putative potassium transport system protein Kup [Candidatus Tokpelaia hoelldobleri]|uniref:Probable potassium transport system protein Kup n=1 Tax=Candidatus Tokpelaia hoelldobleri TaxID=1902579 RepID=A0A1U9JVT3_9HYPH|nr:MAG: Putative potassium transport system protein Kup [Candidatus Tokpelaia hoelldoblerii]
MANLTDIPDLEEEPGGPPKESFRLLLLGALGVVCGDIGTSPIYAFREALHAGVGHDALEREDIFGVISLIFWALMLVVTIKYIIFVLRADNNGEGGILSLMALVHEHVRKRKKWALALGVVGSSLFFGDSVIMPAMSVLSAIEGLEIVAPDLEAFIVPATVGVLLLLFSMQRFGTTRMSVVFGPVMLVWFLALGILGAWHIFDDMSILAALQPWYGASYVIYNPSIAFVVIGAVFLAVTGAEALYADLGHFGRNPIIAAWLVIAFPCLVLNYFGQGAFILTNGEAMANPFYQMVPEWALVPMIILATLATVIASQAVITGAFSMARQAVQLNILPRLEILHTSATTPGQIYVPRVNFILAALVLLLVIGFGRSSRLASAYGIAVAGNMLVTTLLLFIVMLRIWKWNIIIAFALTLAFSIVDLLFFSANLLKIREGAWVSIGLAALMGILVWTWLRGSRNLFRKTRKNEVALDLIVEKLLADEPPLIPGTAIFLTGDPERVPTALMHSLKHYKVLHEHNVILTVRTASRPRVRNKDRARVSQINKRFMLVTLRFGFMEQPNIPRALGLCRQLGWKFDMMTTSFFVSRRSIKSSPKSDMPHWQRKLFFTMAGSAMDATQYFQIPTDRVIEIGTQVVV